MSFVLDHNATVATMAVQTRCPYSTDVLDGSEPENAEHILPVAFGAPDNFTVPAKAAKNTEMNDLIDEPAIHDPIMRLIAAAQGVQSRSGAVKVDLAGTAVETGANVRVTLGQGHATFKLRNPVDRDPVTGEIRGVMGFGDDAQKLLEQFQRDYAKKGKMVVADEAIPRHSDVNVQTAMDYHVVRRELVKIAYLMTVRAFGDQAIMSESGRLYRAAMMASTIEEFKSVGIGGATFQDFFAGTPRPQRKSQHALTCVKLGPTIMSSVTLFGGFNGVFVTPAVGFDAEDAEGEVVIIEASDRKLSSYKYVDVVADLMTTGMPQT
ncbi:hypothetical protein RI103_34975 [Paraburkholderia sp. FT54]|uniref:hypothetical protein n=1 Tax=Paraburkholderia sp. FT54 TaxID=3074437 RepID=UPI0028775E93|nr:hypothetical protein [Paraburkholderia sp. FT54]WNC94378.1 hypothetical protein RI103_34975 [Paraburkholderia sp. FT54]